MHYILSHDYRVKILVSLSKITIFLKNIILKICQQSSLSMPKLPYAEFSRIMRYEYVYTLQQQQKCINYLKIVSLYTVNLLKKL